MTTETRRPLRLTAADTPVGWYCAAFPDDGVDTRLLIWRGLSGAEIEQLLDRAVRRGTPLTETEARGPLQDTLTADPDIYF
ncbi:MAG: hypothetical protein VYB54_14135 [Pseudomonadota bacterium]|nr:hypothetical protein [Pseudomonadota bacterium]